MRASPVFTLIRKAQPQGKYSRSMNMSRVLGMHSHHLFYQKEHCTSIVVEIVSGFSIGSMKSNFHSADFGKLVLLIPCTVHLSRIHSLPPQSSNRRDIRFDSIEQPFKNDNILAIVLSDIS